MASLIVKNGKKMYPVASWYNCQHMFYNYVDRCFIAMVDADYTEESVSRHDEAERLLDVFNTNIHNGLAYAEYADYRKMKDIIGAYILRH